MKEKEMAIIQNVCEKNDVNVQLFKELIEIQVDYANLNMARRTGIFNKINEAIDYYMDKEENY